MDILAWLEYFLGWLFYNFRRHDKDLITRGPAFSRLPSPTISLTSKEIGPSGSSFPVNCTSVGAGHFPSLEWEGAPKNTAEYILIVEDADAPPFPVTHGIYHCIPPHRNQFVAEDFEPSDACGGLKGGFKFGKNFFGKGEQYHAPRGLLGHGPHHYFFQLIALSEKVDFDKEDGQLVEKDDVKKAIEGKVLAWGEWVGVWERKW